MDKPKNVLIVESKNDRCFVEALVRHLNLSDIEVEPPVCRIDDFECLAGLSRESLANALELVRGNLSKQDIRAIGIILDDDGQRADRLTLIDGAVGDVFEAAEPITEPNSANHRDHDR